jgi:asparagine synthase (glutamine-hydrolysing)
VHIVAVGETHEQLAASTGLELRNPFMDLDIIEFAFRCPGRLVAYGGVSKALLRKAMQPMLEPGILRRRFKTYFDPLLRLWDPGGTRSQEASEWQLVRRRIVARQPLSDLLKSAASGDAESAAACKHLAHVESFVRRFDA